ncbi:hypothetical protein HHK36_018331 [Tetracentron sinense]|uniref:Uncharacterized protein n=1 Tax=Tetracentron sinense TaxID=13715 RepID=A0A834YVQ0_TETSI|nr:hypothetical protein HHK36_018331 [Tetracentron sinense]
MSLPLAQSFSSLSDPSAASNSPCAGAAIAAAAEPFLPKAEAGSTSSEYHSSYAVCFPGIVASWPCDAPEIETLGGVVASWPCDAPVIGTLGGLLFYTRVAFGWKNQR